MESERGGGGRETYGVLLVEHCREAETEEKVVGDVLDVGRHEVRIHSRKSGR